MNACQEWTEMLVDHALGRPADAALDAHLTACPNCSQALRAWRQKAAQMDAVVQQLAAAEPRAYAPERVLAQIKRFPQRTPFYVRIAMATLVLAICLVAVLYRATKQKSVPFPAVALSTWRSPTESLLHSAGDPLLKSVPHLGKGFFETKSAGDKNDQ
jgi:predicted anti-sigma-YlaC factor YlaD